MEGGGEDSVEGCGCAEEEEEEICVCGWKDVCGGDCVCLFVYHSERERDTEKKM